MPTMLRPPPLVLLDVDEHGVVVLRALAPHFAQPNTTANRISTRPSRRCCADSSVLSSLLMSKNDSKSQPNCHSNVYYTIYVIFTKDLKTKFSTKFENISVGKIIVFFNLFFDRLCCLLPKISTHNS